VLAEAEAAHKTGRAKSDSELRENQ